MKNRGWVVENWVKVERNFEWFGYTLLLTKLTVKEGMKRKGSKLRYDKYIYMYIYKGIQDELGRSKTKVN